MAVLSIGELLGLGTDDLSGFVKYTDIDGSSSVITSIAGSALSAGLNSATVSAIASSYAESAASGKLDASASSSFYPWSGNPSGFLVSSDISGKADESALSAYQPVSGMSAYAYESSLSSKVDQTAFDICCSSVNDNITILSGNVSSLSSDITNISSVVSGKQDALEFSGDSSIPAISAINGSSLIAANTLATSYLSAGSGLELDVIGSTATLQVSGVEPAINYGFDTGMNITSINGHNLSNMWGVVQETSTSGNTTAHLQSLDVIYTPSPYYKFFNTASASSVDTGVGFSGYSVDCAIANNNITWPTATPPQTLSAEAATAYTVFDFIDPAPGYSAYSARVELVGYGNVNIYNSGRYDKLAPIPYPGSGYYNALFFWNGWGPAPVDSSNVSASSICESTAKIVQIYNDSACIVKQPKAWLTYDQSSFSVGPTRTYSGANVKNQFPSNYIYMTASAQKAFTISGATGWAPSYVKFRTTVNLLPGETMWYLVQSAYNSSMILDICKTEGNSGFVSLDGITYGRGNGQYTEAVYVSAVCPSYTTSVTAQVADTVCYVHPLTTGTVLDSADTAHPGT